MASITRYPKLRERVVILILNLLVLYTSFAFASGLLLPTGGLESTWLIAAFALWLLNLLSSPWFLPPRDALANAITAGSILVTIDVTGVSEFQAELNILRWISAAYCFGVAAISIIALVLHDRDERSAAGRFWYRLTAVLGKGEILYSAPAMISVVGAYQDRYSAVAALVLLWVFFTVAKPIERIADIRRAWAEETKEGPEAPTVGTIDRVDFPNIVRVRLNPGSKWENGTLHIAAMPDGDQWYVFALFSQIQGTDVIGTALRVAKVQDKLQLPARFVCLSHDQDMAAKFLGKISGNEGSELIGFTVENSTIALLRFEIASPSALAEGEVVFARIGSDEVFFQILDAETAEESFDQNPRGTHIVRAAQLGRYTADNGFTKYPWLPEMNSPLFTAKGRTFPQPIMSERDFIVGVVPSTSISVIANIDNLIEYHTAILGVTGTGKTEVALDVIREAVSRNAKVFCVDFTGEYGARLKDLNPSFPAPKPEQGSELESKLFDVETGKFGAGDEKKALKEAMDGLRAQTEKQIDEFLRAPHQNLAVFELAEIANTKTTLRLTELYLSSIMNWARKNRQAKQILIVLEEAHTIIPETFSAGFDYDTQWVVSRIGQIALQGRKYGVGLLVISQRTALVSKTILSQCNTFLTHSLIDQTSLNFLESVYSSQHTRLIPNLGQFEFLAYGKGIRAERPVLLKRPFDPAKKAASDALRKPLQETVNEEMGNDDNSGGVAMVAIGTPLE